MSEEFTPPQLPNSVAEERRWRNRRRMAWFAAAMICFIIASVLFWIDETRIGAAKDILQTALFVNGSIIFSYLGVATLSEAGFWTRGR